ncbi:MAG TPA: O-antigen ligase family protein, partial [Pyrinomonadaceae bacterium]|nr:O-antigen ligase family protein [Pyrinomonadaceae bacterium]
MSKNSTNSSDWLDEAAFDDEPSRLSRAIFFLLCAIPVLATIAYGAVDTWGLGILSLLSGTILILWLVDAWLKKEFFFSANLLQLPLLGLILIGLIQLLPLRSYDISGDLFAVPPVSSLSLDPYATRFFIIQLGIFFIFFAAALTFINNRKRLQKIVLAIIIFGAAMAFFGILQRLADTETIYGIRPPGQAIPFASFVNQHHFAAFMEMTLGITLGLLFGKATKKDKRLLLVIAAVLMGIALILTGSRGGMLSFLGILAFLISANFLRRNKERTEMDKTGSIRRNLALAGSGLALIFILFGSVLLLGEDQSLVRGIGITPGAGDYSSGRLHFWQTALQIFLNNPVIGAGLD